MTAIDWERVLLVRPAVKLGMVMICLLMSPLPHQNLKDLRFVWLGAKNWLVGEWHVREQGCQTESLSLYEGYWLTMTCTRICLICPLVQLVWNFELILDFLIRWETRILIVKWFATHQSKGYNTYQCSTRAEFTILKASFCQYPLSLLLWFYNRVWISSGDTVRPSNHMLSTCTFIAPTSSWQLMCQTMLNKIQANIHSYDTVNCLHMQVSCMQIAH